MIPHGVQLAQSAVRHLGEPSAPRSTAVPNMTTDGRGRAAVVVEGGGMRGVFAAGVLDAFAARAFAPFDLAIGTSAGAAALASHLAGQAGRNRRCLTGLMRRPEFVHPWHGPSRALRGGHWMDLDWLFAACEREDPLDVEALVRCGVEFVVAATSVDTGQPVYLVPRADDASTLLKASSALPLLYRGAVSVRGQRLVDGGVAAAIPVQEAHRRGARRILVVRSRASGISRQPGLEHCLGAFALRGTPALARAIWRSPLEYQKAIDFIARPPAGCTVLEVAPPRPLATGRTTRELAALERDYALGRECGDVAVQRWAQLGAAAGAPARVA